MKTSHRRSSSFFSVIRDMCNVALSCCKMTPARNNPGCFRLILFFSVSRLSTYVTEFIHPFFPHSAKCMYSTPLESQNGVQRIFFVDRSKRHYFSDGSPFLCYTFVSSFRLGATYSTHDSSPVTIRLSIDGSSGYWWRNSFEASSWVCLFASFNSLGTHRMQIFVNPLWVRICCTVICDAVIQCTPASCSVISQIVYLRSSLRMWSTVRLVLSIMPCSGDCFVPRHVRFLISPLWIFVPMNGLYVEALHYHHKCFWDVCVLQEWEYLLLRGNKSLNELHTNPSRSTWVTRIFRTLVNTA